MFLQLHQRDPFFDHLTHYNRLRREMDDLLTPAMLVLQNMSHQQPRKIIPKGDDNHFEVKLDVQQFTPEELTVKMVDNFMVIEGKHEEKQDEHGFISRQFVRRYAIPEDVKQDEITCNLSSDGVLILSAPRHIEQPKTKERSLTINFTGQPAVTATTVSNNKNSSEQQDKPVAKGHEGCAEPMNA